MYGKILVPLDGSELAECILPHVESIARGCGVQSAVFLRVVEPVILLTDKLSEGDYFTEKDVERMMMHTNAFEQERARKYLEQLVSGLKYDGINLQTEVLVGRAAERIAGYAEENNFDLILIATHGRSGVSRWVWGSVADRVLRSACVPVLMARAPGYVSGI